MEEAKLPEKIPGFMSQMEERGFPITDIGPTRELKPSWIPWRNYTLCRIDFKVAGRKAWLGEKYGTHRLEYHGPIPDFGNGGLTREDVELKAYEYAEDVWTRLDKYPHIKFP